MELQLVSRDTAILAKELGFDWKVLNFYKPVGDEPASLNLNMPYNLNDGEEDGGTSVSAPEQELLAKWLRDVHNLSIIIHIHREGWSFNLHKTRNSREKEFLYSSILSSIASGKYIDTYEEAMEVALLYSLNYLKEKLQ